MLLLNGQINILSEYYLTGFNSHIFYIISDLTQTETHDQFSEEFHDFLHITKVDTDQFTKQSCIVCSVEVPQYAFIPCGHLCICSSCSQEWIRKCSFCPICKESFDAIRRIH